MDLPHWPAPLEPKRLLGEPPMLLRGAALGAVAVGAGWLAVSSLQKSVLLAPVAVVFGMVAVLAGWASAIHVTGGERFDDHPFV